MVIQRRLKSFPFKRKQYSTFWKWVISVLTSLFALSILTEKMSALISSLPEKLICTILHTLSSPIHCGGKFLNEENVSHLRKKLGRHFISSSKILIPMFSFSPRFLQLWMLGGLIGLIRVLKKQHLTNFFSSLKSSFLFSDLENSIVI